VYGSHENIAHKSDVSLIFSPTSTTVHKGFCSSEVFLQVKGKEDIVSLQALKVYKSSEDTVPLIPLSKYYKGSFGSHTLAAVLSGGSALFPLNGRMSKPHRQSGYF
jgi:hypothetical protein